MKRPDKDWYDKYGDPKKVPPKQDSTGYTEGVGLHTFEPDADGVCWCGLDERDEVHVRGKK